MSKLIKHPLLEEFIDMSTVNAVFPDQDSEGKPRVMFLLLKKKPRKEVIWEFESKDVRNSFLETLQV